MIDISEIAWMVRRMDTSATLKNFVAVVAILTTVLALVVSFTGIGAMLAGGFGLEDSSDLLFVLSVFVVFVIASFVPLLFIVWDWVARQPWRSLAAINGIVLGLIGVIGIGAALGMSIDVVQSEFLDAERPRTLLLAGAFGLITFLLGAWLVAESRLWRRVLTWITAGVAVAAVVGLASFVYMRGLTDLGEDAPQVALEIVVTIGAVAVLLVVLVRAIRNRIVLSGPTPRGVLLGDFERRGFWVRVAFLTGLPSSLWHARAMGTVAFWGFLLARPLVYGGFALALSEGWQSLGTWGRVGAASAVVVLGHAVFYGAKRLAAGYAWIPDRPLDQRAPILFLRSFEDDQLRFKRAWWNLPRRWLDLWSFRRNADETLIDEVAQYGPVVALGSPGEGKVPFGAQRYYSSHDDWQAIVSRTANQARAIVLAAGDTPGVRWEYEMLARDHLLDKTILLFPPESGVADDSSRAALAAFREATGVHVEDAPDMKRPLVALLPAGEGRHVLLTAHRADAAAYVTALRGFFQQRGLGNLADPLLEVANR